MKQNLLQRAQAGAWLSPAERAVMKIVQTVMPTVLTAVGSVFVATVQTGGAVNINTLAVNCGTAALVTALWGVRKYLAAIGEPVTSAFGNAFGSLGDTLAARTGYQAPNDVKQPVDTPAPATASA